MAIHFATISMKNERPVFKGKETNHKATVIVFELLQVIHTIHSFCNICARKTSTAAQIRGIVVLYTDHQHRAFFTIVNARLINL